MRFLLIDDVSSQRWLLRKRISQKWPDAGIDEYDPEKSGVPGADFPWQDFDIVLLDYDLGLDKVTGLELLSRIKANAKPPMVIMVTGQNDANLAADAIRKGADNYIAKYDAVTNLFFETVAEAVKLREAALNASKPGRGEFGNWEIPGFRPLAIISKGVTTTLRCERIADHKDVILKVQLVGKGDSNQALLQRFILELNILADLKHAHVIEILEHDVTQNMVYYATEFMPLGDLAMRLKSGPLPVEESVNIVAQVASGLTALHKKGIVHRDIKPNNILFKDEKTVVVADLGIAKDLSSSEALTLVGEILGTPYYMSPEQFNGSTVDPRCDMYSLGIVFYQLLTGAVPFLGNSFMEVVYKHNYDPMPALPADLSRFQPVLETMLAKAPGQRYSDLSEFLAALIGVRN